MSASDNASRERFGASALSASGDCEIIPPHNMLALKIGRPLSANSALAVAKAEAALKQLSSQFSQFLTDELDKLDIARRAIHAQGMTEKTGAALFACAHDLKGLGGTFEFPIVTRMAGSLCKLIETHESRSTVPMTLVDAHIDAIRAAVRSNVKDAANPIGRALSYELERQVVAYSATDRG